MTKELLKYKGYLGSYDISIEDNILHGKIECIRDLVTFEAETPALFQSEFEAAVERYLETCKTLNKEPNKSYSGTFNVRVGSERHKQLHVLQLENKHKSINETVCSLIDRATELAKDSATHNHYHVKVSDQVLRERVESWGEILPPIGEGSFEVGPKFRVVK